MNLAETERKKYEKVFSFPGYGNIGHGAPIADYLMSRSKPGVLGDFGCGRGASFDPYLKAGFEIIPIDHVDALKEENRHKKGVLPFFIANLWEDELPEVDYGICTDVMEHIPEEVVSKVIENVSHSVKHGCLWSVCHVIDVWGDRIGERLHMTIKPREWWLEQFKKHWKNVEVLRQKGETTILWTDHGNLVNHRK